MVDRDLAGLVAVVDLDATVWLPEVYTLRGRPEGWLPTLGEDVRVLPGAQRALDALIERGARVAVASRSSQPAYSVALCHQVTVADGRSLAQVCGDGGLQIYAGDKQAHVRRIVEAFGCAFGDVLFFDDARDGRYGNCVRVSELGCLAVHTPGGLDEERLAAGLAARASGARGVVVEAPAAARPPPPPGGVATLPCVSLAMPFAALLLNGAKTIETRNSRLFAPYAGRVVAIRVGKKDWDSDDWKAVHPDAAGELKRGFRRGDVAGTCLVGETRPLATFDDVHRDACGVFDPQGKFGTVVAEAAWFPKPLRGVRGAPAIYDIDVPRSLVPNLKGDNVSLADVADALPDPPAPAPAPGLNRKQRRAKARVQSGALGGS